MHLNLETIISLIEIGTFALLTVIILNEYKKLRAKPLLYLAGSMGIFVVVQLIGLPSPANVNFNDIYIAIELMMLGVLFHMSIPPFLINCYLTISGQLSSFFSLFSYRKLVSVS